MVTEEWQYSRLNYENCIHNIGSGWNGVCRMFTEMVVDWSMQTLQKIGSGCGSGSGVDWNMQTLYRRVVVVVDWNMQTLQASGSGSGLE